MMIACSMAGHAVTGLQAEFSRRRGYGPVDQEGLSADSYAYFVTCSDDTFATRTVGLRPVLHGGATRSARLTARSHRLGSTLQRWG